MEQYWQTLAPWLRALLEVAIAAVLGLAVHLVFWSLLRRLAGKTRTVFDDSLLRHAKRPSGLIVPVLAVHFAAPLLSAQLPPRLFEVFANAITILLVLGIAWLLIALGSVLEEVVLDRFRIDASDNLTARTVHTQVRIVKKIISAVVVILALAAILMTFERVRQVGAGLLASAGLAGLVVGLSAQRVLANILAGIQIAFTQPMRIDDVVIVEGEWGWIEEITLTYVVVRIWDLRRLVLPISYFIEKPFQNWTRTSADILGTVFLHTDFTVPVDAVREELNRIVAKSDKWDGKVASVQITGATAQTMEVRALVSSTDSGKNWDLRCEVREKLIEFVQRRYPGALPRTRAELQQVGPRPSPAAA
ncbi:MAG: mechanosensitive ion channel [Deltaproteobacteria bacterium]|nr:mechanosensitive ion channel [Deltaproteobacteria bacterium]